MNSRCLAENETRTDASTDDLLVHKLESQVACLIGTRDSEHRERRLREWICCVVMYSEVLLVDGAVFCTLVQCRRSLAPSPPANAHHPRETFRHTALAALMNRAVREG